MGDLLALKAADRRARSNGPVWADCIRERIYLAGSARPGPRPHDDRQGAYPHLA